MRGHRSDPSESSRATARSCPVAAHMKTADLFRLDGRVAFISGGAGHLGREMAWALGQAGAKVILNGRNANRLSAFANELGGAGIPVECAAFDMMEFDAVRQFFAARHRIDVLINNA